MNTWARIIMVVFVLIGAVAGFAYWSVNQFNQAFDDLRMSCSTDNHLDYRLFYKQRTSDLASTTPELVTNLASSTDQGLVASSTVPELSFSFPQLNTKLYIGCDYQISWESSSTVASLETTLIDYATRLAVEDDKSGLIKEQVLEADATGLTWKLASALPGSYYLKISKINDFDTEARSEIFTINKMPENSSASERKNICKESGAIF